MGRPLIDGVRRDGKMNFAFTSNLKKSLEKLGHLDEIPTSRLVEKILQDYVDSRADDLEKYDAFMTKIRESRTRKSN